MTVRLAFDPDADPVLRQAILDLHDPAANQIAVAARPGMRRGTQLYADLMSSVGRFLPTSSRTTRAPNDAGLLAMCWLTAMDIERILIVDAGLLHGRAVKEACQALVGAGIDVWLCADARMDRRWRRAVERWSSDTPAAPASYEDVVTQFDHTRARTRGSSSAPSTSREPAPIDPETLPHTSYLTFRADLRAHLAPAAFELADGWYVDAFLQASDTDLGTAEVVAAAIERGYGVASGEAGAVIAIKAVQAAAFRQGIHVDLTVAHVADALHITPRAEDWTQEDWDAILAHHDPARGAAASLWASGLSPGDILRLRTSDVAAGGAAVTLGSRGTVKTAPEASVAIRALRLHQIVMHGGDPLLFANRRGRLHDRWLDDTLNEVADVLGRALRLSDSETRRNRRWWEHAWGPRCTTIGALP